MRGRGEVSDAELLEMLDLADEGRTIDAIAERFGRTRGTVSGWLHRIRRETEPSRHDGTMPAGWWRDGLRRQERARRDPVAAARIEARIAAEMAGAG